MAETVHLFLKSNGSDVKGDSTQESLGRKDSIECISYQQSVSNTTDDATKMATGRRQYTPITIRKRIDKASPLLIKALVNNEKIDGAFKFFRPSPTGDGTTEQFYTVTIKEGHVSAISQCSPDTLKRYGGGHERIHFRRSGGSIHGCGGTARGGCPGAGLISG
jgi:type VI secretion system secreted protein Hcp